MTHKTLEARFKQWLEEFQKQVTAYEAAQEIMGTFQLPEEAGDKIGAYTLDAPEIHAGLSNPLSEEFYDNVP